jgi:diaminohydroxyphosphoribosylaminopyrimidine deaminase/5-amino-6-(5-phosphoribosylamino)uracil reductase
MTGSATVRFDDPRLDVRMPEVIRQPLRVVLDTQLRTPPSARIVASPGRLLLLTASADEARKTALEAVGASVERISAGPGGLDLSAVMRRLAALEVNELQVECGSTLAGALLTARFVDELVLYLAPTLLGTDARPLAQLPGIVSMADRIDLSIADLRRVGPDLRITLRPAQG